MRTEISNDYGQSMPTWIIKAFPIAHDYGSVNANMGYQSSFDCQLFRKTYDCSSHRQFKSEQGFFTQEELLPPPLSRHPNRITSTSDVFSRHLSLRYLQLDTSTSQHLFQHIIIQITAPIPAQTAHFSTNPSNHVDRDLGILLAWKDMSCT